MILSHVFDPFPIHMKSLRPRLLEEKRRFLEISPDFRKASLAIGFEPQEQCVACRALSKRCAAEPATGADGLVYRQNVETAVNTVAAWDVHGCTVVYTSYKDII